MSADALAALLRLNEHARAPDWEQGGTPGRVVPAHVIYGLKAQAIRVFTAEGRATHRPIVYRSKCGTCGGSGWYRRDDENGCRTCGGISGPGGDRGRGYKDLRFVETTIHALGLAAFRWHSPAEHDIGAELWGSLTEQPGDPRGWTPRLPGLTLPAHEAVALLNLVEAWLWPTWLLVPPVLRGYSLGLARNCAAWQEPSLVEWVRRHPEHNAARWASETTGDDIPF